MKIVTILGTRPEIIKLSPLIPLLEQEFEHLIVHTGQHYDYEMDEVFFQELHLPRPRYNLSVGSALPGKQTGIMIEKIEHVLLQEKPDLVIVEGDTNTVLAGAITAAKLYLPLLHVEAGCRSFNRHSPEEINRIIADHLADYLLAPDKQSVQHLRQEGCPAEKIFFTGSTVFDATARNGQLTRPAELLHHLGLSKGRFVLATIHRAENTDDQERLKTLIESLNLLAEGIEIIFPVHPRTRKAIQEKALLVQNNIKMIEPLPYLSFLGLLSSCKVCISDSGGIQEEAVAFNVPCLIPMEETPWSRLVEAGKNILLGTRRETIIPRAKKIIHDEEELQRIKSIPCPSPAGASQKIMEVIKWIEQSKSIR
ncbi:MAG: UDP-N-acetylglucosamine 2-epimerase (non-hydrolyzing) [Nanoarchaeota archaeon]